MYAGTVVPVYIRSNINQVYVIGVPDTKEKIEVPLWQISSPVSKRDAAAYAEKISEYSHIYASVLRDGLPVRSDPDNSSKQVYRLRRSEIVKVIQKGEGAPVMAGDEPLDGDWLYVLTNDGTTGWCFSYNLDLYDEFDEDAGALVLEEEEDPVLENIFAKTWYPERYKTMIDSNRIDPTRIDFSWGFDPGRNSGTIRVAAEGMDVSFPYNGISKHENGSYGFTGTSVVMQSRGPDTLIVQYADDRGMPKSAVFVALDVSMQDLVQQEQERRNEVYERIRSVGPVFSSSSYGVLQLLSDGRFIWSGYNLLSPSVIPANASGRGTAEVRLFMAGNLFSLYDGVISFKFDDTDKYVNFLYRVDGRALRLEDVSDANIRDMVVFKRNDNPLILYFASDAPGGTSLPGEY